MATGALLIPNFSLAERRTRGDYQKPHAQHGDSEPTLRLSLGEAILW